MTDLQFNIYRLRKKRGIKQQTLAKELNINRRTYITKETGTSEFKESEIIKIKNYFNVSYDDLFLPHNIILND